MKQAIIECFQIDGRGTAVVVPTATDLPAGKLLNAIVGFPEGGEAFRAQAFKEFLLRREAGPVEQESYLLIGVTKDQIPDGAVIEVAL